MMNWYGEGMSGWGYVLMTASFLAFCGLVIIGVVRSGPARRRGRLWSPTARSGCSPSVSRVARSTRANTAVASRRCADKSGFDIPVYWRGLQDD